MIRTAPDNKPQEWDQVTDNDPADKARPHNVFSFRADFPADVEEFFATCNDSGIVVIAPSRRELQAGFPDVAVQFESTGHVTVDQLRSAAAGVLDLHVVLETLRAVPLADNPLERATPTQQHDNRSELSPEQERWITDHMPTRRAPSSNNYGIEL